MILGAEKTPCSLQWALVGKVRIFVASKVLAQGVVVFLCHLCRWKRIDSTKDAKIYEPGVGGKICCITVVKVISEKGVRRRREGW